MKTAKRKGTRNERRSRDFLEARGFMVTRAGGSLGVWDLIAIKHDCVVLVQVKSNRGPGPTERRAITDFAAPPSCVKVVHVWKDRQDFPEITRYMR